ncbi:MFS transporter [Ferribacterium limneticum]|uniref:MFS transporter n=1 Tax=Ferribacterium limneticum TaxID=76259 RepID=UPI001CF9D956|nr:MFS transporter [Ferribacterium limneticum]UCV28575.1 MFS transporter [Ferribacterium limneticum]UCV32492.1 MFS transporter [Ferribacterium limneticum]
MTYPEPRTLWLRLFLPFAAGYFLSYLFRTVNAVIGPVLARELNLGDNALGLLTSTYFLAFGLAQLPLGMLLDRFGPRRVEAGLLVIAATGAAVFSLSDGLGGLATGRALIGLGVSACLMASFKAFSQWFPPERQASLTGWIMASGGLGALAASKPLEIALGFAGWREIAFALAVTTLMVAALLWLKVPDKANEQKGAGLAEQLAGVKQIFASPHFWRYAPMGFFFTGGFMAVQGLWASRWMSVLEGMEGTAVAARLTWISGAMLAGFLFMGFFATALVRRGIKLEQLYLGAMVVALACFAAISSLPTVAGDWLWPILGICFSLSNISYSLVSQSFPPALSGRANTALNLLVFAGAFGLQWGIGGFVDALQANGWAGDTAYRAAFFCLLGGQVLALGWILRPARRA